MEREATVAKNATVQNEGGREVTRKIEWFNLDVIISVGYRVNSKRGTKFRIWATSVLKDHLVNGYTLNQKRLAEKGITETRQLLSLLGNSLEGNNLHSDEGVAALQMVNRYACFWQFLWQYDEDFPYTGDDIEMLLYLRWNTCNWYRLLPAATACEAITA